MRRRNKITIVGAGNVGATAAHWAVTEELGDVVLIDIMEGIPQGKALDLYEATPIVGSDCRVVGTNDYKDTKDSDVVVITAGLPRKPGMSRDDLLVKNANIVKSVTEQVVKYSPDCVLVIVSNPLDAMAYVAKKASGFPKNRVIGMAGVLDTARFKTFLSEELDVSVEDVQTVVLGGHGDDMVPFPRLTTIGGVPATELIPEGKMNSLVERARKGGAEIVNYLKTGSAFYAPGASVIQMVDSILKDKRRVLPCAAYLEGEFGVSDIYLGVPAKIGANGVEKIIEFKLNDSEKTMLNKSVKSVQNLIEKLPK
jgi:malate dehydrogenase